MHRSVPVPPRRYTDIPLPPYRYRPGASPHPVTDPGGHMYPHREDDPSEAVFHLPRDWRECREYLYGVDLFNAGFYWEAHESWESAWKILGRASLAGHFLQGLIQTAAALVKRREGNESGVEKLMARAERNLDEIGPAVYMGVDLPDWRGAVAGHLSGGTEEYPYIVLNGFPDPPDAPGGNDLRNRE
ncbi:MAG: DUF309 domain-containing protein [Candidatus Eisenbacteria bacterium]